VRILYNARLCVSIYKRGKLVELGDDDDDDDSPEAHLR